MKRKVCAETLEARKMIENTGCSAYAAAKAFNLSGTAITRSQWFKDRQEKGLAQHQWAHRTPVEKMALARRLVEVEGKSAYAAAKQVGVAQSTISRTKWYLEFKQKE